MSQLNIVSGSRFFALFLLFIMIGIAGGPDTLYASNPFLERQQKSDHQATVKQEATREKPIYLSQVVSQITVLQMQMKNKISTHVRNFKTTGETGPLIPLFLLAFGYGAIHAAGPGHGKGIAMTYAMAKGRTFRSGASLGALIAAVHAGSAILLVSLIQLILHKNVAASMSSVNQKAQITSYGLLTLIGIILLVSSVYEWFEKEECGKTSINKLKKAGNNPLVAALAIGLVPCPGVIMILLFCLSLGQLLLGILLGITVSLGMALTITAAVWISLAGKNTALFAAARWERTFSFLEKSLHTLSAFILTIIGTLFLYTAISG